MWPFFGKTLNEIFRRSYWDFPKTEKSGRVVYLIVLLKPATNFFLSTWLWRLTKTHAFQQLMCLVDARETTPEQNALNIINKILLRVRGSQWTIFLSFSNLQTTSWNFDDFYTVKHMLQTFLLEVLNFSPMALNVSYTTPRASNTITKLSRLWEKNINWIYGYNLQILEVTFLLLIIF